MIWQRILYTSTLLAVLGAGVLARGWAQTGPATGAIAGSVTLRQGTPASGVVVFLAQSPRLDAPAGDVVRTVVQKDLRFSPDLTVIPRGGTVEFPNDDRVFHNVFSLSSPRRFDLGLYRDGASRSVTFPRPGVVDVYCNIHPDMKTRIKVVPNSFYALTDVRGRFRITDVPAGEYTLRAWNGNEVSAPIRVRASDTATVRLDIAPASMSKRHLRKDGTPYRRYR